MTSLQYRAALLAPLLLALGCGSSDDADSRGAAPSAKLPKDALPDGLYADFFDGKFDGTGHPLDAEVWEAESGCSPTTGIREAEGRGFHPTYDAPGTACAAGSKNIGKGRFTLNAYALATEACEGSACDEAVIHLSVTSAAGTVLGERDVLWRDFVEPLSYQNLSLVFSQSTDGPVTVDVRWLGNARVRLDYVELFRSARQLILAPPSGVIDAAATLSLEAHDPPNGFGFELKCDEMDLTDTLAGLVTAGTATQEDTEFRSTVSVPAADLLASCTAETRLRVSLVTGSWTRATSRLTRHAEEAPCTFSPDTTRVLLTGFEPFPADSTRDNSSEQAVLGFDPAGVTGVSVMRMILPVEFDTAAGMVQSAIARCNPDIVVGFGQGRSEVDLETTAYNKKDSSALAGGVPDNRGIIAGGETIVSDGSAELSSGLPLDAILTDLQNRGIASGLSDDPGRYICNNIFYRIMTETNGSSVHGGFVHLPRIANVTDADRQMLADVVQSVVQNTLAARQDP